MAKKNRFIQSVVIIFVVAFVILSVRGDGLLDFSITDDDGYSSAFEGVKARFYGVEYGGNQYTSTLWHSSSLHRFDTVFRFDSDGGSSGKPNIIGEETSVFVPTQSLENYKDWIPSWWFSDQQYIQNPIQIYEWEINDNLYYMEQWLLRYYVTFSAEWDGAEAPEPPWYYYASPALMATWTEENCYANLNVWLKFDMEPTWYIEGGGTAYFAIGKVQLANNVLYSAKDVDGNIKPVRNTVSISPESTNSLMYLHYNPFGETTNDGTEKTAYDYQNQALNPDYFTDELYSSISFNNFGVFGATDLLVPWKRGDTATMCFDVTVFVIGEWTVQDIEEDPDQYGRFVRDSWGLDGLIDAMQGFLSSPYGWIIILGVVFVLILVFAPWIFTLILGGGKKR